MLTYRIPGKQIKGHLRTSLPFPRDHWCDPAPHNTYLLLHIYWWTESVLKIAHLLADHLGIETMTYPKLGPHENHTIPHKQMWWFGGEWSFALKSNDFNSLRLFLPLLHNAHAAANLGAVETIAGFPATTSHIEYTHEEQEAIGIPESLIRYSIWIEDTEGLIADYTQASSEALVSLSVIQ